MSYTRDSSEDLIYNSETGQYEPVPTAVILTIIPTPSDATVTFSTGTVSGNTCTVEVGTSVTYTVSKEHYNTESDTVIVDADTSITVTLAETLYTYTINPTPSDANVTLIATGYSQEGKSISVPYNTIVNWSVSKDNYTTQSGTKTIIEATTDNITLNLKPCTLNIVPTPSDATVILTAPGYSQFNNSITVPYGTTVSYEVLKEGYVSQSNTINVVSDTTLPISLTETQCIITVNPDPTDATVILTAQGYTQIGNTITVNYGTPVSVDVSKDNYNSIHLDLTSAEVTQDITLTPTLTRSHYILTVNTTPLDATITFSTGTISQDGHSCTVPTGTTVDYTVSKTKYVSQSFSAVMNSDKTVNVTLAKQTYTLTINTTPENTLKQLYINGSTTPITITSSYVAEVDTSIRYIITKFGFIKVDSSLILDSDVTLDITLDEGFLVKDLDATTVFTNNTDITSVNLNYKPWVNNSMAYAFSNCSNLQNVTNINNNVTTMRGTFRNCRSLVNAPEIPSSVTNLTSTFSGCSNLVDAPVIPNLVSNMYHAFGGCSNLVNAPTIPNSVTDISFMFDACTNLINAPTIPNSVRAMTETFYYCTNLVDAPEIPNSVRSFDYTFAFCDNLVNAPIIPDSVTYVSSTFRYCQNLAGNIYIYSMNITDATNCFNGTTLTKNVYIPFKYENSEYTQTYNAFTSAGYDTLGTQHGVYLKDINVSYYTLAISPTPEDATVVLIADGYTQEGNSITVEEGTSVTYTVSKPGYNTETDTITVNSTQTLSVSLTEILYTLTVTPTPSDATVKLEASDYQTISGTGAQSISVRPNTTVTYTVSKSGYDTETDNVVVTQDPQSLSVSLNTQMATLKLTVNETGGTGQITAKTYYTSSLGSFVDGPELMLDKEMQAPVGDTIYWIVRTDDNKFTAAGYNTLSAGANVTSTSARENKLLTLDYTPTDATITVTDCTGFVVAPKSTSAGQNIYYMPWWGGSGGQSLNTSVTITGSATGYYSDSITATRLSYNSDTTAILNLVPLVPPKKLNVEDYNYTGDSNNNITLTTYIGTNTSVIAPELEEI